MMACIRLLAAASIMCGLHAVMSGSLQAAWQPNRPIELVVPAASGGSADQMARAIQEITGKHQLLPVPIVVVNKPGGAGSEAFLDVKQTRNNPHKLIITLSNLFTTPIAMGIPFNWREITPVAMVALDEFVLWVNEDASIKTARDYVATIRGMAPGTFRMGGTGSRQDDQIITGALERIIGVKFASFPTKGSGEGALQLSAKRFDATIRNPIEAVDLWRGGKLRPVCVFDASLMQYPTKIVGNVAWGDIPTCQSQGLNMEYRVLRGIFMAPGVSPEQVNYYVDLVRKLRETPEWRILMGEGAFSQTFLTGADFIQWMDREDARYRQWMREAGFPTLVIDN